MTQQQIRRQQHTFIGRGAALEVFNRRDDEVLLAGPAGTGKSRAAMEKLHLMALLNPGMRGLIIRKTATSLTSSALKTWERDVVNHALSDGSVWFHGGSNREPPAYRYTNGSTVAIGGMDKPIKVMSTEYDVAYVQEATEFTEDEWESLSIRLRSGRMSFQQIIADCNPAHPTHWLKQRVARGQTVMLHSRHEDNPRYFNADGTVTVEGAAYMARLDALTGVRRLRLRDGIWAASEGVIYEDWDEGRHVIDPFVPPKDWPRYWSIDFGFVHPFVWQDWTRRPDGCLILVREIYHTKRIVADHCKQIKRLHTVDGTENGMWKSPRPQFIVADHDAEDRATFEREMGWGTTAANKTVSEGIQAVQQRFRTDGQGRSRMEFMRNACVETDQDLVDRKMPTCTVEEIPGYVWAPGKEQPVKDLDDGCDAKRYLVAEVDLRGQTRVRWG
jgi:PBSX family phage terminase large subunit